MNYYQKNMSILKELREDLEEFEKITPTSVAMAVLMIAIIFYIVKNIL